MYTKIAFYLYIYIFFFLLSEQIDDAFGIPRAGAPVRWPLCPLDTLPEWLRGPPAKRMCLARGGSNPPGVAWGIGAIGSARR